jgi:subtilase family serine protease
MLMTAVAATALVIPALTTTASASSDNAVDGQTQAAIARVCPAPPTGYASCDALRNDSIAPNATTPSTTGKTPAQLLAAYNLPGTSATTSPTVAIVDAYHDPTAEADLGVYRAQYGLPSCTKANGCFRQVSQTGSTTSYPKTDASWSQEISLDLDMVSAACPTCHILLVEGTTPSFANLGAAVNYAASQGVAAISNSYGGTDASDTTYGSYYNHPGVAVTVSSGDNGYGVEYPASSQYVTAVGGTSLRAASNARGWTETAWSGAGSGCSTINPKPTWQHDAGCAKRAVADVSAVADPNTGVNVYDSTAYRGSSGWLVFGGTSASSPIIASVFALGGHSAPSTPYSAPAGSLNDVTSGSNGSCGGSYLCTAVVGFDGPTGLGTPNGTGAF